MMILSVEGRIVRNLRFLLLEQTRECRPLKRAHLFAFVFVSLLCGAIASPLAALEEERVFQQMIDLYAEDRDCAEGSDTLAWERRSVTSPKDGYRIRYSRFGCVLGPLGAIVLLPGRGEGAFEYYETAIDFTQRGFGPIYVLDHRGQGLSPRLLEDPHKGHVATFEDYIDDSVVFVEAVTSDLGTLSPEPDPAMFLTSNSMGGAIAIGLFQRLGADNPFRAAALLGAMINVNYHGFTGKPATWINLRIYSELGALGQAHWRCGIATFWNARKCEDYALATAADGYQRGSRTFSEGTQAIMTQSAARYDLRTYMMDDFDWSAIAEQEYGPDENWPGPQLGAATNGWVRAAARFNRQMRKAKNLRNMVHVPVLLLTGTEDLRAYTSYERWRGRAPDLSRHTEFCNDLNAESLEASGKYICTFRALNGGYHELYKERDKERTESLDTVEWFFRSYPGAGQD